MIGDGEIRSDLICIGHEVAEGRSPERGVDGGDKGADAAAGDVGGHLPAELAQADLYDSHGNLRSGVSRRAGGAGSVQPPACGESPTRD